MHDWLTNYSNFNDKKCVFTYIIFLNVFLLPFTKVKSQINKLQIFSNFGSEMVENRRIEKSKLLVLCHSLLMDLRQYQQQHRNVHSGGVNRVPYRSPSAHFLLPFRKLGNSELCHFQPFSSIFSSIYPF